jgi:hypothetical protein
MEVFDLIGKKDFKGHGLYEKWQAKRLFFNTSWWFYGSKENFKKADKSKITSFDVGVYYPSKGLSNNEIAALSRSQHQSQGFGISGSRGSQIEYFEFIKGDFIKNKNLFSGIDTSWKRVKNGKEIGEILKQVEQNFDFNNPSKSIPELLKAYQLIDKLDNKHWRQIKLKAIKQIIESCLGLFIEVSSKESITTLNNKSKAKIEIINRSDKSVKLKKISNHYDELIFKDDYQLNNNKGFNEEIEITTRLQEKFTAPYWLEKKGSLGMYVVDDLKLIGNPETIRPMVIKFDFIIETVPISFYKNIVSKYTDPVNGEIYQPFEILPEVTSSISDKVIIFSDENSKKIFVNVTSNKSNFKGNVSLIISDDWQVIPKELLIEIDKKGGEKTVEFTIIPPKYQSETYVKSLVRSHNADYTKELIEINYNHIPKQTILLESKAKIVRLNINKKGKIVAYIHGAGDKVPESLRQIGYSVVELKEKDITSENLKGFDAVILGIRAYNVNKKSKYYQKELHKYMENGGTLIVQYNTNRRLKVENVAPYPLKLSNDRVVDENAKVTFINKNNELLNYPNKISETDFDNWVQERGLYFPNEWSKEFTPILSMNDKGETAKKGSLLVAKYGKGHFIYTGLSFFRELPAGVPGAYKLFSNMISIGKNNLEKPLKN